MGAFPGAVTVLLIEGDEGFWVDLNDRSESPERPAGSCLVARKPDTGYGHQLTLPRSLPDPPEPSPIEVSVEVAVTQLQTELDAFKKHAHGELAALECDLAHACAAQRQAETLAARLQASLLGDCARC